MVHTVVFGYAFSMSFSFSKMTLKKHSTAKRTSKVQVKIRVVPCLSAKKVIPPFQKVALKAENPPKSTKKEGAVYSCSFNR
jgi:hypothetical protein